jgi:hypothetical protein
MLTPSSDEHVDQVDVQQAGRRRPDLADSGFAGCPWEAFQGAAKVPRVCGCDLMGYGGRGV